jgi:hypothetical protein
MGNYPDDLHPHCLLMDSRMERLTVLGVSRKVIHYAPIFFIMFAEGLSTIINRDYKSSYN